MLPYNKICEIEDFIHPDLLPVLRKVYAHELIRFGQDWPKDHEYRKDWEVAMCIRTFQDMGLLRPDAEILGIGAGNEPTIFYLTNHVRRVFATDLYLPDPSVKSGRRGIRSTVRQLTATVRGKRRLWSESANMGMFLDPGRYWPGPWNPRRLVVQHMNGLDLKYEDASFDAIFSSSSIEHFGGHNEIRKAMQEMYRVLKPGGLLSLATEYRLAGPSPGLPGILMFDEKELTDLIIGSASWEPVNPFVSSCSPITRAFERPFVELSAAVRKHVARYGEILYHKLDWQKYPSLGLQQGSLIWTSVHLALRKRI